MKSLAITSNVVQKPLHQDKLEVQKQWDSNPCGAETGQGHAPGTLDFYRAVRSYRYKRYAPWMDHLIAFSQWHNKKVLEIGVGLGSDHYCFAQAGNCMTALDLSREHLRQTQRHLELEGLWTNSQYGDAEKMPFADASFDLVYTFGVIHHTPNTEMAIAEIHRVLRPGGSAIVGLYHRNSVYFWLCVFLVEGVLKLGFARKGWRGVVSTIEYRSNDNDAVPLVKVYSRREVRRLFSEFSQVKVETAHIEASHFYRFAFLLRGIGRAALERWFGRYGWYIVVKAGK